jgi:hypothetical protein
MLPQLTLEFRGTIWYWRGPAPHYFVTVPPEECDAIKSISSLVTYGWGVIPVRGQIGNTEFKTSLFPKNGGYIVPLKVVVRKAENLSEGDEVTVQLDIG